MKKKDILKMLRQYGFKNSVVDRLLEQCQANNKSVTPEKRKPK